MTIHFNWEESMSVGDDVLDAQHKRLLSQINKVLDAIVFGVEAKDVQDNMISFLNQYIEEHLSYEEEYMRKINYPDILQHIQKHRNFILNYDKFKEKFDIGEDRAELITEIEQCISSWWLEHIGKEDKKYQLYLEGKKNK